MNAIQELFQQAQLAEAAYSNLAGINVSTDPLTLQSRLINLQPDGGYDFSPAQATAFVAEWQVVDQYTAPSFLGLTGSGFSATVLKNIKVGSPDFGKYTLTMRGTAGVVDLSADANDVLADGIALDQVVDMYNYWQSLTHAGTFDAKKLTTLTAETAALRAAYLISQTAGLAYEATLRAQSNIIIDNPTHTVRTIAPVSSTQLSDGRLRVGSGVLAGTVTVKVDGHSLGGHLAMAFSRLFPSATASVTAINGAGFGLGNTNVAHLFAMLSGATGFDASKITNVVGSAAMNLVSQDWLFLQQPAGRSEIYTESAWGNTLGHGSSQMTDSLALYSTLAQLAPSLTIDQISTFLKAASAKNTQSFEFTLDALRRTLLGSSVIATKEGDRDQFYTNLYALQKDLAYTNLSGHVTLTSSVGLTASGAKNIFAEFLALNHLTPFVLAPDSSAALNTLKNANPALAASWEADTALTAEQRAAGLGNYTDLWYADRAAMLSWLNVSGTQDKISLNSPDDNSYFFKDIASDRSVALFKTFLGVPLPSTPRWIVFGSTGADSLNGESEDDHLYGGAGKDVLTGNLGNDYLEGGKDFDLYRFNNSDGGDTVVDIDGKGLLMRNGNYLSIGVKTGEGIWSAQGVTFSRTGNDLTLSFTGSTDVITLKNFDFSAAATAGYLGIHLYDAPTNPSSYDRTILGDISPSAGYDSLGNPNPGGAAQANRADILYDSVGNDLIQSFGGDDEIRAEKGGDDRIEGGIGSDIAWARGGNDVLLGGTGDDLLRGDAGKDRVYAGAEIGIATALSQQNAAASGAKGDLMDGGDADDQLFGDSGNDLILGGLGNDLIIAGAGDDNIYGDVESALSTRAWTATRSAITTGGGMTYQLSFTNLSFATESDGGNDLIYGGGGADWVHAGRGDDYAEGGEGNDVLFGGAGSDVLIGGNGNDLLVADSSDVPLAEQKNDYLDGGAGNDTLQGLGGDDILYGGAGNDYLNGGAGKDTYIINRGDGVDHIVDTPADANAPEASVLVLGDGILRKDVKFRLGSLLIDLGGGDGIHLDGFDADTPQVTPMLGAIQFADGSAMNYQDILDQGFDINGTANADTLTGTGVTDRIQGLGGNDTIQGKKGDDFLLGGFGDDSYVFNKGDGQDQVTDTSGSNTIRFGAGITLADIKLNAFVAAGAGNLDIAYDDQDSRILVYGGMSGGVDQYQFDDGIVLSREQLIAQAARAVSITAGDGNDVLQGMDSADTLNGGAGDDALLGNGGSDTLDGGAGNDQLDGGAGDDLLQGGAGDDTLEGGVGHDILNGDAGNDSYLLSWAAGQDTVIDDGAEPSTVKLGKGIALTALETRREGNDLYLGIPGPRNVDFANLDAYGNTAYREWAEPSGLTIKDYYAGIQSWQVQTDAGEVVSLTDVVAQIDIARNDVAQSALTAWKSSVWQAMVGDYMDYLTRSHQATGVQIDDHQLITRSVNGQDIIAIEYADVSSDDAVIDLPPPRYSTYTPNGIYTLTTSPTTSSGQEINNGEWLEPLYDDSNGEHVFLGFLRHGGGDEATTTTTTIEVQGYDAYTVNTLETLTAGSSDNLIYFYGTMAVDAGGGNDLLIGDRSWGAYSPVGNYVNGGEGNDRVLGSLDNDVILAGDGNDYLSGGDGDDTYLINPEDTGVKVIDEASDHVTLHGYSSPFSNSLYYNYGESFSTDTVEFAPSVSLEDLSLTWGVIDSGIDVNGAGVSLSKSYSTLDITWGDRQQVVRVTMPSALSPWVGGYGVEFFKFADGTTLTADEMKALAPPIPTGNDDILTGTSENDTIDALGGNDQIYGLGGADTLYGGEGGDIISGGRGDDSLYGGAGNDVFLFERGDGYDTILEVNNDGYGNGSDVLRFLDDLSSDDIRLNQSPSGVTFAVGDVATDRIFVASLLGSTDPLLAAIKFSDGSSWTWSESLSHSEVLPGTELRDIVGGTDGADSINALGGDDEVYGGYGTDLIHGGGGADNLSGDEGNDSVYGDDGADTVTGGSGNDLIFGGNDDDYLIGHSGDDILSGGSGDDSLQDWAGHNALEGNEGNDSIAVMSGPNFVAGGRGDDYIYGQFFSSTNIVVAYNRGDGNDRIPEIFDGLLVLSLGGGITAEDLVLSKSDSDYVLATGLGDTISYSRPPAFGFSGGNAVVLQIFDSETRIYDFGSVLDQFDAARAADPGLTSLALGPLLAAHSLGISPDHAYGGNLAYRYASGGSLDGLAADDIRTVLADADFGLAPQLYLADTNPLSVIGGPSADVLTTMLNGATVMGRTGDDAITATGEDVTIVYGIGDGTDHVITGGSGVVLKLAEGITASDLSLDLGSLALHIGADPGDVIHFETFDAQDVLGLQPFDHVAFADGTMSSYADLIARGFDIVGGGDSDQLSGTNVIDRISGNLGNDILNGNGGDDNLAGGTGDDTYLYALGGGHDRIDESSGVDRIVFGAGIQKESISITRDNGGVVIAVSSSESIRFAENGPGSYAVERIEFADGTVWLEADVLHALSLAPPVVANPIGDQVTPEDATFVFVVPAGTFADVDAAAGDTLRFGAALADGSSLPGWLSFDAATQTLSGTPGDKDVGNLDLRVIATDLAGNSVAANFSLQVVNVNDAPSGDVSITGTLAQGGVLIVGNTLTDVDGVGQLSYQWQISADGNTWTDIADANGTTFTLTQSEVGRQVRAVASYTDGYGTAESVVSLATTAVANVNDAPIVTAPIADAAANEDAMFQFVLPANAFGDSDGESLVLSAILENGDALPAWLSFDAGTGTFSGTPANADAGSLSVRVQATDAAGAYASQMFALEVINTNDAPVAFVPLSDVMSETGAAMFFVLPANAFVDVDADDTLAFSAQLADGQPLPDWLVFDAQTQRFSGTPTTSGAFSIVVSATDAAGASANQRFNLTVSSTLLTVEDNASVSEDHDLLAAGNVLTNDESANAGTDLHLTDDGIRRGNYGVLSLLEQGNYGYVMDNRSSAVQALGTGQFVQDVFEYTATDGENSAGGTLIVTVAGRNDRPDIVLPLANRAVPKGASVNWNVSSNFVDVDTGDTLAFTAKQSNGQSLPSWLKFDSQTGIFSGQAPSSISGKLDITVTASDGHGNSSNASDTFRVALGTDKVPNNEDNGNHGGGSSGSPHDTRGGSSGNNSHDENGHDAYDDKENALAAWFDKKGSSLDLANLATFVAEFEAWSEQRRNRDSNDIHKLYNGSAANGHWQRMNSLLDAHLFSADNSAIGDDYDHRSRYFGNLADLSMVGSRHVLMGSQSSIGVQAFQSLQGLQEGLARLG